MYRVAMIASTKHEVSSILAWLRLGLKTHYDCIGSI